MLNTRVAAVCLMGWILTASGAVAGSPDVVAAFAPRVPPPAQQRLERTEVFDADTGAELRLTARPNGAIQASLAWTDLDVRKVMQPGGDFHVRIAGRRDLVVIVRAGDRLRVTRNGQSAQFVLSQVDEDGLDQVQQVLAGSRALRLFRSIRSRLGEDSLASAPGVSIDNLDILLGIVLGEPSVANRRSPKAAAQASRVSRVACVANGTCYSEYETEVGAAWGDFSQCIDDVKWLPGVQELCAMTWLLRIESAWFRFIGCSSFPLRAT